MSSPTPPFARGAARRMREQLGLGPEHVARAMRASYGVGVTADVIIAWERGTHRPGGPELQALAGALWCDPADLLDAPGTLLEHRWVRGLAAADLARIADIPLKEYERIEQQHPWSASPAQTAALGAALALSPPELLRLTGRAERLAELLREAAATRWQPYVRPVAAIAPVPRDLVEAALERLHREPGRGEAWFLDTVLDRFWAAVSAAAPASGADRPVQRE